MYSVFVYSRDRVVHVEQRARVGRLRCGPCTVGGPKGSSYSTDSIESGAFEAADCFAELPVVLPL